MELEEKYLETSEDQDWMVEDTISVEQVKDVIEGLPDKYRYVVQLFLVEGFDHEEIAGILGITNSASRTRLLRGKTYLKEKLKNMVYGTGS